MHYAYDQGSGDQLWCDCVNMATYGTPIGTNNLRPGDLLFYDWYLDQSYPTHVAIYAGNGKIVEALNEHAGVILSDPFENGPVKPGNRNHSTAFLFARRPFPYTDNPQDLADQIVQQLVAILREILIQPHGPEYTVNTTLNLRENHGTSYGIIGTLHSGDRVTDLDPGNTVSADGYDWYHVHTQYGDGWCVTGW